MCFLGIYYCTYFGDRARFNTVCQQSDVQDIVLLLLVRNIIGFGSYSYFCSIEQIAEYFASCHVGNNKNIKASN